MIDGIIVFSRLLQFGCTFILFGLPLFCLYGLSAERWYGAPRNWPWFRRTMLLSALGALLGAVVWAAAQAALFFPNAGFFDPGSLSIILIETGFGHVTLFRVGILIVAIAVILGFLPGRSASIVLSLLGGLAASSFAWAGHGAYDSGMSGAVHLGADILHLLTASIWFGALVALVILIIRSLKLWTEEEAISVLYGLERFSVFGPATVALILLTGIVNTWFLVGPARWMSFFTTAYGIALTVKIILFGGMLVLAAINRYRLSPQLAERIDKQISTRSTLTKLRLVVMFETLLSIGVLGAVALLGTWEPPIAQ